MNDRAMLKIITILIAGTLVMNIVNDLQERRIAELKVVKGELLRDIYELNAQSLQG